ncbi:cystathionine gamma-synthase [Myriangium duriaei CBS 260.36]|uniref:Cystathionine gamma-synthase n=1 Tax=Myriangium duriaei CBS 260.36 TaxID=1168546 RepID=A0A9P4MG30_9PEZI|nr:cystathionine gamma-synthase [Myriangium duriaei CBS 260.36]
MSGPPPPRESNTPWSPSTLAIHADDPLNSATDVAPPLHLATTFRYPSDPSVLLPAGLADRTPSDPLSPTQVNNVYSRISAPNTTRLESILSSLLKGRVLAYSSGLAAFHALLVHVAPKVVAIGEGYHGCHGVLGVYRKLTDCIIVDIHDESTWSGTTDGGREYELGQGDLVHLETPLNPSGENFDVAKYAQLAHKRGARLSVDATFAPPPLLEPWKWGADYVMHSGTKYFGGHSDMLLGVVAVSPTLDGGEEKWRSMFTERLFLGATPGNLESWLGVRSLRTLELRVVRQSESAERLVGWLEQGRTGHEGLEVVSGAVKEIRHGSLQPQEPWVKEQMPRGFAPVFGLVLRTEELAKRLPGRLRCFHHATSLGGVESLIEWRAMSDEKVDKRLLRISVGVEDVRDLWADLVRGLREVLEIEGRGFKE